MTGSRLMSLFAALAVLGLSILTTTNPALAQSAGSPPATAGGTGGTSASLEAQAFAALACVAKASVSDVGQIPLVPGVSLPKPHPSIEGSCLTGLSGEVLGILRQQLQVLNDLTGGRQLTVASGTTYASTIREGGWLRGPVPVALIGQSAYLVERVEGVENTWQVLTPLAVTDANYLIYTFYDHVAGKKRISYQFAGAHHEAYRASIRPLDGQTIQGKGRATVVFYDMSTSLGTGFRFGSCVNPTSEQKQLPYCR